LLKALAGALDNALDRRLLPAPLCLVTPRCELSCALALEPFRSRYVAPPVLARSSQAIFVRPRFPGFGYRDAVDGTGRQAQLAAGAFCGDHRMHELRRSDNGIDRARLDAQRAADARRLLYDCYRRSCYRSLCHGIVSRGS
jgi:hypothetical protein